jgi:hypothetical protein
MYFSTKLQKNRIGLLIDFGLSLILFGGSRLINYFCRKIENEQLKQNEYEKKGMLFPDDHFRCRHDRMHGRGSV